MTEPDEREEKVSCDWCADAEFDANSYSWCEMCKCVLCYDCAHLSGDEGYICADCVKKGGFDETRTIHETY